MIKITSLALALVFFCAMPASAANQCYSKSQVDAEQLLRLHSELMVITVTCHEGSKGENLVPAYTGFTKSHLQAIKDAEQTLIAYYHAVYGGSGVDRLDRLRTRLGNEFGQKIAQQSAPIFCGLYRDKVLKMCDANSEQMKAAIADTSTASKPYEAMCVVQ